MSREDTTATDVPSTGELVRFGLKWTAASLVISRVMSFLTTIVLARLLAPEMFGLVAMANVTMSVLGVIREIGFGAAFIQRQFETEEKEQLAANTVFFLILGVNALLFVVVTALTPQIAAFFRVGDAQDVMHAVFLLFLLDGLFATPGFVLRKRLLFGKLAIVELVTVGVYMLVAIPLAASGFGVWSLVAGQILSTCFRGVALYRSSRWYPGLVFDRCIALQLFRFGKYLWAFSAVSAVGDSLDRLIVGRWLGASNLGIYGLAYQLCKLPATQISFLVNRVMFPAFSRMQAEPSALRRAFVTTISHISLLTIPLAFGIFVVADDFVRVVYGEKWSDAVPVVEILAFYGMTLSVSSVTGPVFQAIGRPQVLFYTSLVHHALALGLLLYLAEYGLVGIAVAVLVPAGVSGGIAFALIIRYLELEIGEVFWPVIRAGAAGIVMCASVAVFQTYAQETGGFSGPGVLFSSIGLGVLIYVASSCLVNYTGLRQFVVAARQVAVSKGKLV